jgi:NitT/TauT family transport system ATP-binding protein
MSGPPPINVAGLRKVFRQTTTGQSVIAIDRLDLTIAPREVVAIVGQTGCGKSSFFDLIIGLEAPTEGAIHIGDKSPHTDFDLFRGRIATVFQQDRLLPWRSALDNAKLPLELIGLPEDEQRQRALTWLKRLGLEHFANAYPHELSGGMRKGWRSRAPSSCSRLFCWPTRHSAISTRSQPRNCVRPFWRWRANAARPQS